MSKMFKEAGGIVIDLAEAGPKVLAPSGELHPVFSNDGWVLCPDNVRIGMLHNNGVFSEPEVVIEPAPDLNQIDTEQLNHVLSQEGSVVRAIGVLVFKEINKLRVNAGLTPYTMDQFKTALKNEMRN